MPALADLFGTYYLSGWDSVDFASIRVHVAGADRACRALNARAFTVGSDIYVRDGAPGPRWAVLAPAEQIRRLSA